MKIAICDDITEYRLSIKAFANEYFKIHNIEYIINDFKNGTDLLNSQVNYDILFLDIELGDSNGIEISKNINHSIQYYFYQIPGINLYGTFFV